MPRRKTDAWECAQCGWLWLPTTKENGVEILPEACPSRKCRSKLWNRPQPKPVEVAPGPRVHPWKAWRAAHKMTQEALSELLGITSRTVQNVEAGKVTPRAETQACFRALQARQERKS